MRRNQDLNNQGFTLIELLVAMTIFGMVLLLANSIFMNANSYTTITVSTAEVEEDVRLGLLRVTEVLSQAAYVYPNGTTLKLKTGNVVTGQNVLATLVPIGSPYCPAISGVANTNYCLFVYQPRARSGYAATLSKVKNPTANVLVEQRIQWVLWSKDATPASLLTDFSSITPSEGVVMDSLDTALTDFSNLGLSQQTSSIDKSLSNGVANNATNALIQVVQPTIAVQVDKIKVQRGGYIYIRSIPRVAPPGTGI